MNGSRKPMRLSLLVAACILGTQVRSHSLPDPDKVITLELPQRNVEKLAAQVEAVLLGSGFKKGPNMPRLALDMSALPPSASADQGVIVARLDKDATLSIFMHVTACRVSLTMRLPSHTDKKVGHRELQATQDLLVSELAHRENTQVTLHDGFGSREDPCAVPVRSNTSLERARGR
jgi:hypothetical protein